MDNYTSNTHRRLPANNSNSLATTLPLVPIIERNEIDGELSFVQEGGDPAIWEVFTEYFRRVQLLLDLNRILIQQVNENHQSKIHDNLVKNVALIQEINTNISKVVSLYSEMSVNFSSVVHQSSTSKNNSPEKK